MAQWAAIDAVEYGSGFVVVSGWLAVPCGEAWPDPVLLRVGSGVHPITHWFQRGDLPADAGGHHFLAFHEDLPWTSPGQPVEDVMLELPGHTGAAARADRGHWRRFTPAGHLESVSQFGLSAWVYDPGLWRSGAKCSLALDDAPPRRLCLNLERPDLPYGAARRGERLGILLDARSLARALAGLEAFDNSPHRWSLVSSGVVVASSAQAIPPASHGRLEAYHGGKVRGWAAFKDQPDTVAEVELRVGGVRYAALPAARGRDDLREGNISRVGGGFAAPLQLSLDGSSEAALDARVVGEARVLPGSPLVVSGLRIPRGAGAGPWRALAPRGRPRVSLIVPVFNAADDLARCLDAVVSHTGGDARLIVIDDASTDPRVPDVLARYRDRRNVEILTNPANLGFTRTCNAGIRAAGQDDVVLLNSDTVVPERWLENLIAAAYATPRTGSATPLSDNAGVFSAPEPGGRNALPAGLRGTDLSRLAAQASLASFPEVPTGHGFCLYLRRDMLDVVGLLDEAAFPRGYGEENDLCMRASRSGFRHVLDDRTYVQHRQSASFGTEKSMLLAAGRAVVEKRYPEYGRLVRGFLADEAIAGVHWRVRRAFESGVAPRPRILFVISTETGGTPQTNLDLMCALQDRYEPWLLRSDSRELTLSRLQGGELRPVERRPLERPVSFALHASEDYDETVGDLLLRHSIELVHVRHLAWHGLGLTAVARALGIPVLLSLHDFYAVCPTIKLLDDRMQHCAGRCTPGGGECRAELWPEEQVPPLKHQFLHRWREMLEPALAACDAFVTTSTRAREIVLGAYPLLARRDFRLIPHGRSFAAFMEPGAPPSRGAIARVLVPGNISAAKGADILRAMARLDRGRHVEFHVLGDPGELEAGPGLVIHGRYARDEFAGRVAKIAPNLGAVLSIWPETYCHTLTEMWASGLPVFALDLGAVGERLRAHGGGWLSASRDPHELLEALLAAVSDAEDFARRLDEVRAWQRGAGAARGTGAMATDYDLLYRELAHRRLAFASQWAPPPVWLRVDVRADAGGHLREALTNRTDAPVAFRAATPSSAVAAVEAGNIAGVVLLSDGTPDRWPDGLAQACAVHGMPLVLCAETSPPTMALRALAGLPGAALALPSRVERPGVPAVRVLDLDAAPAILRSQLTEIAAEPRMATVRASGPTCRPRTARRSKKQLESVSSGVGA